MISAFSFLSNSLFLVIYIYTNQGRVVRYNKLPNGYPAEMVQRK